MQLWQLTVLLGAIIIACISSVYMVTRSENKKSSKPEPIDEKTGPNYGSIAEQDVEHIFNDEFRQELRNRGRLHFEKIIGENAMFLQQDLRLTTSQLNDYMKTEITRTLKEEFAKYEQSITDAKQLAIDSISKTQQAIDEQRQILGQRLEEEVSTEKERLLMHFEENMAEIINHYVLAAIGDQIDLDDQLEYILNELEANKKAMLEDVKNGA